MTSLYLRLELEADLVQTARPQTVGVHESLEYVRGATLYGAAAAALYARSGDRAYRLFHAGAVRFGDAVPLVAGLAATPAPLGWYHPKGRKVEDGGALGGDGVWVGHNTPPEAFVEHALKQVRSGYFLPDGTYRTVRRNYALKTAVDRGRRGAPREGQLYGYESLPAGTRWLARIDADDPDDLAKIRQWIGDGTTLWLGRSRGAEYGRTRVVPADAPGPAPEPVPDPAGRVVLHLLSDLALSDPGTGEPTLTPAPALFGLGDGWRFDPEASSVVVRAYSPFNGKRRCHDLDRRVLARGCVLVFQGGRAGPDDLATLADRLAAGVGHHRQEGLGRVAVNPGYLAGRHPAFDGPVAPSSDDLSPEAGPEDAPPLVPWLRTRARRADLEHAAVRDAERWARCFRDKHESGRPWPSRSQWNRVAGIARACVGAADAGALRRRLEDEILVRDRGGVGANQWAGPLRDAVLKKIGGGGDQAALTLYHAARLAGRGDPKKRRGR